MEQDKRITKILYDRAYIEKVIYELAQWVNETYKNSNDLVIVGLLKGSIPFLAQLIKDVKVDHIIDFMTLSSYDGMQESSGSVKVIMDLAYDIYNKDVLIIEDIIDSGITIEKVVNLLNAKKPKSLKTLTLLNKQSGRKNNFNADKYGIDVPDEFLVGFGLDVKEKLRNLPYIGIFNKKEFNDL
ncbi:hypoxanthine phosphoribosyltransferase [Mesomycoplasma lagogenitalium]|uniref:Hypoxanthine phosphoribosyltransferase n=1 Tax=Mesomycoplasma lagogenitalium TaxID=171286 RepID=A0ABY8LUS6_9BACT|nr:hypoxanthine phosphoribosyltransferase [Mesomycoplasma lagogenitalium]WGI36981.1 hypoxanthine phosphoribosyltransferase [Mesomycoplasma lagogenitalium]